MRASEISNLAVAINRWLSYQRLCGRSALLSEAYLSHPVAEFLIHRHGDGFASEVDHPVLTRTGAGRPRQIDFALQNPESSEIETAIECKWIGKRRYDKQRILNDLLRLECLRAPGRPIRRYFVVAGLKSNFDENFKSLRLQGGDQFTKALLSFSVLKQKRIKVVGPLLATGRFRRLYEAYEADFAAPVPRTFATKLIGYRTNDEISVAVWQVACAKSRAEFSPANRWSS